MQLIDYQFLPKLLSFNMFMKTIFKNKCFTIFLKIMQDILRISGLYIALVHQL